MTRKLRIIGKMGPTSLLLSTALADCPVGPDYTAPKTELAPFHNDADASSAQGHSAPPLDRWWTGFDDPMLVTVVQRTLNENLDLDAALARVRPIAERRTNDRFPASHASDLPFRYREEFRTPRGVRKSPRNEPAGPDDDGLWVFLFSAARGAVTTGCGKHGT
jgi:hypothetical protein